MIQSDYVCPRFVTVGLGSRWHNWSPNIATVTGRTFLPTREVPILCGTRCINNQTPGRSNAAATRGCLATAVGILLVSPANIQQTTRDRKERKIFISLLFLRSPWRVCEEISRYSEKYKSRIATHPNWLAAEIYKTINMDRRLKRKHPADLIKDIT